MAPLANSPRKLATSNRHLAALKKTSPLPGLPSAISAPALDVLRKGVARPDCRRQGER